MMNAPANIRRQIYHLSVSDLEDFLAWEFALDEEGVEGQDEGTVRPYLKIPVDPADGGLVVRTKFELADGTAAIGFVSPPPPLAPRDIANQQPSIVTSRGHVPFYFGVFPPELEKVRKLLNLLGKSSAEVFPLSYETDIGIIGCQIKGTIPGFCFLEGSVKAGVIKTMRT